MPVVIQPTREFVNVPHSLTSLSASIYGKYIDYKGSSWTEFTDEWFSYSKYCDKIPTG